MSAVVGPAGGSVGAPIDGVGLEIPPGALSSDVEITISVVDAVGDPEGRASLVWQFEPSGLIFLLPVRVSMAFTDRPGDEVIGWTSDIRRPVERLPTTRRGDVASADIDHFSYGWVLVPPTLDTDETDPVVTDSDPVDTDPTPPDPDPTDTQAVDTDPVTDSRAAGSHTGGPSHTGTPPSPACPADPHEPDGAQPRLLAPDTGQPEQGPLHIGRGDTDFVHAQLPGNCAVALSLQTDGAIGVTVTITNLSDPAQTAITASAGPAWSTTTLPPTTADVDWQWEIAVQHVDACVTWVLDAASCVTTVDTSPAVDTQDPPPPDTQTWPPDTDPSIDTHIIWSHDTYPPDPCGDPSAPGCAPDDTDAPSDDTADDDSRWPGTWHDDTGSEDSSGGGDSRWLDQWPDRRDSADTDALDTDEG